MSHLELHLKPSASLNAPDLDRQPCFFPFQLSTGRRTPLSSKELFIGEETLVFSERLLLGQDIMCMKGHYIMYHALLFEPAFPEAANGQGQAGHFFEAIVVFCMSKSHKVLQVCPLLDSPEVLPRAVSDYRVVFRHAVDHGIGCSIFKRPACPSFSRGA